MSRQKGDIMREVLISLKPYYYYLIGEGIKKVEVRKSYPKAEDWSRNSWFYMSRDEKSFAKIPKEFQEKYRKHFGRVGMRFVCDRVIGTCAWRLKGETGFCAKRTEEETNFPNNACLTLEEIEKYAGSRGRGIYGWQITDLVVYDKPRELCEFFQVKAIRGYHKKDEPKTDGINIPRLLNSTRFEVNFLTRPPQSWCYIETRQTAD